MIGEQIAIIRRKLGVPIIFHVEDYVFGDAPITLVEKEHHYFSLLEHGLRFGVDYMVVDLKYSLEGVKKLVNHSGRTKIIGQFYAKQEVDWSWHDEARMTEYTMATNIGCDLVKFARQTSDPYDNEAVQLFRKKIDSIPNHLPVSLGNLTTLHTCLEIHISQALFVLLAYTDATVPGHRI